MPRISKTEKTSLRRPFILQIGLGEDGISFRDTEDESVSCIRWGLCPFMGAMACAVWDERGVAALEIGFGSVWEAEGNALAAVGRLFRAGADLLRDDAGTHALLDRAARGEGPFSVHLLASERELGIWAALAGIPRGKTCTYAELAQQAGLPRGYARSVGTLLAGNKIALILPCHRVIPADGGAGKYRWGADLKADLLHTERR